MPLVLAALLAGLVYDFVTTVETPRTTSRMNGRVWIDGNSFRAELAPNPSRDIDVVISNDGDRTAVYLDVDKQTWVDRVRVNDDVRSSSMFLWPLPGGKLRGKPVVAHRAEGTRVVAGHDAMLHVITVRIAIESKVDKEKVRGTIEATARIWIADALPPQPMNRRLRTGYPDADRQLEPIFASLNGLIVQHELEVTRTMEGGPPQREVTTTTVSGLEVLDVPMEKFRVPVNFAHGGDKAP